MGVNGTAPRCPPPCNQVLPFSAHRHTRRAAAPAAVPCFWGTCRRPARPCTRPHADTSRGGVVVLVTLSKAKEVSGTRSRRASGPGRSRALWQNSLAGPVNEVTTAVLAVGKMSNRTRSRPWRQYPDPYQPPRTRGDAGSTRWRPRAPTSPYGDGTSRDGARRSPLEAAVGGWDVESGQA